MKSKVEIEKETAEINWNTWCESKSGVESHHTTDVIACLNGTASDEQYNALEEKWVSYGPGEVFRAVGPSFGPFEIHGKNAIIAYGRCD